MAGRGARNPLLPVPSTLHNHPHPIPDDDLPVIAVGLLSYNRCGEVITTLDAFEASDYPRAKLRLVVIDNASSDGTAEAVRERYDGRVEVLQLPENMGAVARNRVMLEIADRYVFTFDEDCTPEHSDTLRRVVEFMEANPYFGALCFRSVNLYSGDTEFGNMGTFSRRRLRSGAYEGMFVLGAGMCYRSEAVRRTGGYDERLFWGGEEYGLTMELLYHDVPIALEPRFTLVHRQAPRAMAPSRTLEVDTRNNIWSAFKFFPLPLAVPVAGLHSLRRLLTAVVKRRPGGAEAVLRGVRSGVAGLRPVLATRTPIPISKIARHNRWFFQMFYALRTRHSVQHEEHG